MDIKRSPLNQSPFNRPKQTNLMQPFINISKASTPVRTRLVATGSQMNSTPVNINKMTGNVPKSPSNKENFQSNQHKVSLAPKAKIEVNTAEP